MAEFVSPEDDAAAAACAAGMVGRKAPSSPFALSPSVASLPSSMSVCRNPTLNLALFQALSVVEDIAHSACRVKSTH